jgi:signal transduction histidine kinase
MEGLLRLFCLPSTGIAALFFVSVLFVTNMLKPIKESQEKQSRFIAAASHELRSPLSVICANNSAIASVTNESQKFIEGIDKECKRMARLINDMLILASADAKSWEIKKEPVETDTLLIETYEAFLPLCLQKDHSLSLELPEEALPAIISDKERLKQVLLILLDNALAYSPNNKDIILRSYTNNHFLYLEVQDHGVGIADKDKKLIFDRFTGLIHPVMKSSISDWDLALRRKSSNSLVESLPFVIPKEAAPPSVSESIFRHKKQSMHYLPY